MPDGQKHYYGVVIRKLLYNYRDGDCGAAAIWLQPYLFFFCEVAANHNTGIGMVVSTSCGVIVYSYFYVFRLTNKGNLLFAVVSFI